MDARRLALRWSPWLSGASLVALLLAGCGGLESSQPAASSSSMAPSGANVMLDGKQEVPPVNTAATGHGTITVLMDRSVSETVTTTGVVGTAAHIHDGAKGVNGPVIVPLNKTGDNTWEVPPKVRVNDVQYEAYIRGNLYVNVHSAANPNGEIRGQIVR